MKEKRLITNGKTVSVLYMGDSLGEIARKISGIPCSSVHVIIDRNAAEPTERLFPGFLDRICGKPIFFDATEHNKTLSEAERICRELERAGADRDSLIVAIGGGITTDMAGFVSSVYRRGVRAVFVPTTLLAQVDAAIGGKNGVNLDGRKNMIGTVRQPLATFLCTGYIPLMHSDLLSAGLAEMLKIFMIMSPKDYDAAVKMFSVRHAALSRMDGGLPGKMPSKSLQESWMLSFADLVFSAASMKIDIVAEDQFEHGRRELLNLGHTFAHAIECVTRGAVPHGRAVAEGIMLAARAGAIMGITDPAFSYRIENDFNTCGIVGEGGACDKTIKPSGLLPVMLEDKKKHGDRIHLVIPKTLGDVVSVPVTESGLKKILSEI